MLTVDTVILDMDGTLVESNSAHARAWVKALGQEGFSVDYEEIRSLIGMGSDKLLPTAVGLDAESDKAKKIAEKQKEIFGREYQEDIQPTPGAKDLLTFLKENGIYLIVASSSGEERIQQMMKTADIKSLVDDWTSSDDADKSKPHPEIIFCALERTNSPEEKIIMLGDTPYDIEAAAAAGITIIAFRCGGWNDEHLEGAAAIYDHPADLLKHIEQSPLCRLSPQMIKGS
jgi:HAD superfamily hydrolase (TIGR01549 family)